MPVNCWTGLPWNSDEKSIASDVAGVIEAGTNAVQYRTQQTIILANHPEEIAAYFSGLEVTVT